MARASVIGVTHVLASVPVTGRDTSVAMNRSAIGRTRFASGLGGGGDTGGTAVRGLATDPTIR